MGEIEINIKGTNEKKFSIKVDVASTTVGQLKEKIEQLDNTIPKDGQRLIYGGRILKDEDLLEVYNIKDGNSVHLVVRKAKVESGGAGGNSSGATTSPSVSAATTTPSTNIGNTESSTIPAATAAADAGFGSGPFGAGMFGQEGMPPWMQGAAGMSPEHMERMMNDPMIQQVTQTMLSNPELLRQMIDSNPMLANTMTPEMRQAMLSPAFMNAMSNPEVLRSLMQMQSAMSRARGGTASPGTYNPWATPAQNTTTNTTTTTTPAATTPGATNANTPSGQTFTQTPEQQQAMQQLYASMLGPPWGPLGSNPFTPFTGGANQQQQPQQPQQPPEERYATQLQALTEMGFWDTEKNIRALVATGGNVHAAVDYLLRNI
ncbi:Ubiquitin domain-containing protein DSK2 [Zancudomyces culisetae]|uniref:Ubiquitin domain-containing protein DSK2 n=1 Tax=Zancudomyces culisetae TaxID=1213189 RepID=A0A1R1PLT4_ZANCU|nr:Ubiquitin domain-containing protein DSK2 [Zancudomyces culisetae]|eukprot:OMH81941.1 Ubiquitin domain-containing protein DSK2 [Zancudomyces culisetae]